MEYFNLADRTLLVSLRYDRDILRKLKSSGFFNSWNEDVNEQNFPIVDSRPKDLTVAFRQFKRALDDKAVRFLLEQESIEPLGIWELAAVLDAMPYILPDPNVESEEMKVEYPIWIHALGSVMIGPENRELHPVAWASPTNGRVMGLSQSGCGYDPREIFACCL